MGLIKNLKLGGSFADLPFSQWDGPQKKPPQRAAFPYSSIIQRDTHEFSAKIHTQFLTRFGSDLLSHALRRSTIGAAVLNCRVRDGIGCFTCAMTTKPRKEPEIVVGRLPTLHQRRGQPRPTSKSLKTFRSVCF